MKSLNSSLSVFLATSEALAWMFVALAPWTAAAAPTAVHTFAGHQITMQASNLAVRPQPVLCDSGFRAAFAAGSPSRLYVVDADSANVLELDVLTNAVELLLDLTFFGETVVFSDGTTLRLAPSSGPVRELIALQGQEIKGVRISGGGSRVFFLVARDSARRGTSTAVMRGLYRINPDGTGMTSLASATQVASLLGIGSSEVVAFEVAGPALDISADGGRIVFGTTNRSMGHVLLGINNDGTGLHAILTQAPPARLEWVGLSGDGTNIGYRLSGPPPVLGIIRFDGTSRRSLLTANPGVPFPVAGEALVLSGDGSRLLAGQGGLLINTDGSGWLQLCALGKRAAGDPAALLDAAWNLCSMNSAATRFLQLFVDDNAVRQLALLEMEPASLNGAPNITSISVDPTHLRRNNGSSATLQARTAVQGHLLRVSNSVLREGLDDTNISHLVLHDDGMAGDGTAGDGVFSDNGLIANASAALGPRSLRVQVESRGLDGRKHATAIELAPFFVTDASPPAMGPLLSSLNPGSGVPGMQVTLNGANFDAFSGNNVVLFGNRAASVVSGSTASLTVIVPAGLANGPVSVTVSAYGLTSNPLSFTVLTPRLEAPGAPLQFGNVIVGQSTNRSFVVRNAGGAPLSVTRFSLPPGDFFGVAPAGPFTLAPGGTQTVTLRFTPTAPGTQSGPFSMVSNDPMTPIATVPLVGIGVGPDIEVTPIALDFGSVLGGEWRDRSLLVRNTGNAPLTVSGVARDNPRFRAINPARPFQIAPGAAEVVTVRFSPCAADLQNGLLQVQSNDPDEANILVALQGRGEEPSKLTVTLNARDSVWVTFTYPNGRRQLITMNLDASFRIEPQTPVRNAGEYVSANGDLFGPLHVWGEATDSFSGETFRFDNTFEYQRWGGGVQTRFDANGEVIMVSSPLAAVPHSSEVTPYQMEYHRATGLLRVRVRLPQPWVYAPEDEYYEMEATACVAGGGPWQKGALQITLSPVEAVQAGAQWRVDAGPWQSSGGTVTDLSLGSHTVEFSAAPRWKTPALFAIEIREGQLTQDTASYIGMPDLGGSLVLANDSRPALPGKEKTCWVTVTNSGTAVSPAAFRIDVFLSADTNLDAQDIKVGEGFAQALERQGLRNLPIDLTLAASTHPGLDRAGIRYLIARIDSDHWPDEISAQDNLVVSAPFWMGQVLNIITHGFNPRPPWLLFVGEPWEAFFQTSYLISNKCHAITKPGTLLENRVASYVVKWDSSWHFLPAFTALFVAKLADAYGACAAEENELDRLVLCELVASLLKEYAEHETREGAPLALEEAARVYREFREEMLLPDVSLSRRFQRIHLIGHSRGAALNARMARILAQDGYWVDQYTALDGFSTDWPSEGGMIGDIRIVEEARGTRKFNYRVEQAIDDYVVDAITLDDPVLQKFLEDILAVTAQFHPVARRIHDIYPSPCVLSNLASYDLRAPERAGFANAVIRGQGFGTNRYSNHLNIQDLYAASDGHFEAAQQAILDNFVGLNREATTNVEEPRPQSQGFLPAGDPELGSDELSFQARQFRDGDFEQLGSLSARARLLGTNALGDELVDAWVSIVADPHAILSSVWGTSGDVRLIQEASNTLAALTATNESAMSQRVFLQAGARSIHFDLVVAATAAGGHFEMGAHTQILHTVDLDTAVGTNRLQVPLEGRTGSTEFFFRLVNDAASAAAQVRLDNIRISYVPPFIDSIALLPDGSARLTVACGSGETIIMEESMDLQVWSKSSTQTASSSRIEFLDPLASDHRQRFYRVRIHE